MKSKRHIPQENFEEFKKNMKAEFDVGKEQEIIFC